MIFPGAVLKPKVIYIGHFEDKMAEVFAELNVLGFETRPFADLERFERTLQQNISLLAPAHLILIDHALVFTREAAWLDQTFGELQRQKVVPSTYPTRFIFIAEANRREFFEEFRHQKLYDVFYKPVDFTQAMQKGALLATLPSIYTPKYLYVHKVAEPILMTKLGRALNIADYGFTMESTTPIKIGSLAQFRLPYPSKTGFLETSARCYASVTNGAISHCKFNFTGLKPEDMKVLRDELYPLGMTPLDGPPVRKKTSDESTTKEDSEKRAQALKQIMAQRAAAGPAGKRFTEKHRKKIPTEKESPQNPDERINIAIIDMNRDNLFRIQSILREEIPRAKIYPYPTYSYFYKNELRPRIETGEPPKRTSFNDSIASRASTDWVDPAFTMGNTLFLTIEIESKKLVKIHPKPGEVDKVCGHSALGLLRGQMDWRNILHADFHRQLDELIANASQGIKSELDFMLQSKALKTRWFEIGATIENLPPGQVRLIIKDTPEKKTTNFWFNLPDTTDVTRFDAVIMNANFVQPSATTWSEELHMAIIQAGLKPEKLDTAVILFGDEKMDPLKLAAARIHTFLFEPIDRRQLMEHLGLAMDYRPFEFQKRFLGQYPFIERIEIGRHVDQEEVTENSIYIKSAQPMHIGSTLIFHSSLLTDDEGQGLWARCIANFRHPTEKGLYRIQFLIYGIAQKRLHDLRHEIHKEYVDLKESS